MTDLKPCPFCGSAVAYGLIDSEHGEGMVCCDSCVVQGPRTYGHDTIKAAKLWDTRPSPWKRWGNERPDVANTFDETKGAFLLLQPWAALPRMMHFSEDGVHDSDGCGFKLSWVNDDAQWLYLVEVLP